MAKNFSENANEVVAGAGLLEGCLPETMEAFAALGRSTYRNGALSPKIKELLALAIGVTVRCDGCVSYHARRAFKRNATREEVAEALGVAIHMGGGPSMVYAAEAMRAFDAFAAGEGEAAPADPASR